MAAFDRLSGAMQYQIVNTLGFRELRPVQLLTIDAILDGKNCVVLAPTAGGKTEAAFFPILSAMDAGDWKPVSVIYLSPIRALLNNQEDRVARYAATIGRRVFKWHGDTTQSQRKGFLADPADILLTTPESLEAMLMSPKVPAGRLFAQLKAVIVDEIHAFAGQDRGAHLAALLERFTRFCGADVQRIGLSATVGNPDEILRWVNGRSSRAGAVVSPPRESVRPNLALDHVGSLANAAHVIANLHRGKKRLVFVDSRRNVEELGKLLLESGLETHIIHGSLAQAERRDAERAFAEKQDCVIVSTSALELGIDVGDLDHVLQIDCPSTVASFLQRMGRTGRRPGTIPNCTFLTTKDETTLQAAALLRLHKSGFVEPVHPSGRAFHILAHQLMALTIQHSGIRRGEWFAYLDGATPFADTTPDERNRLVDHMLAATILSDQDGKLWLGEGGEKRYGRRNFEELYAVFSSPRLITVQWGTREIGTVDADFLEVLTGKTQRAAFSLSGKPWDVTQIDWRKGTCYVEPATNAAAPRWSGFPAFLGYELVQAMRQVLISDEIDPSWSKRATESIASLRVEKQFLHDAESPLTHDGESLSWWTYAGGRANVLVARMIEAELGGQCVVRNDSITCKGEAGKSEARLRDALQAWVAAGRPNRQDALQFAKACAGRIRLSKFQPCLPDGLLDEFLADSIDHVNAARVVSGRATRNADA
jgi:ATP-dependent Lhr-like helicase